MIAHPPQDRRPPARRLAAKLAALLTIGLVAPASANIDIVFDYRYDTANFFANPVRRNLLDAAAAVFESRLTDNLTAITSGGGNNVRALAPNPADPNNFSANLNINNYSVAAGVLQVFVASANIGGALGAGGGGAVSATGNAAFIANARQRGQVGSLTSPATDYGPWGGSIGFSSSTNFYFDPDPGTMEAFSGYDFYSVAIHELAHVLGIGVAASWYGKVNFTTDTFTGPASGVQPLEPDDSAHWASSLVSDVNGVPQQPAMTPRIGPGERKHFTTLDFAGLSDVGWQVAANPVPEPATLLLWAAGLGGLGLWRRRRPA